MTSLHGLLWASSQHGGFGAFGLLMQLQCDYSSQQGGSSIIYYLTVEEVLLHPFHHVIQLQVSHKPAWFQGEDT